VGKAPVGTLNKSCKPISRITPTNNALAIMGMTNSQLSRTLLRGCEKVFPTTSWKLFLNLQATTKQSTKILHKNMKSCPVFNLKGTVNPKKKRINTGGCTRVLLKANPAGVKKNRAGPKSIASKYEANKTKTTMTRAHDIKRG
jgi:hypothetical protein